MIRIVRHTRYIDFVVIHPEDHDFRAFFVKTNICEQDEEQREQDIYTKDVKQVRRGKLPCNNRGNQEEEEKPERDEDDGTNIHAIFIAGEYFVSDTGPGTDAVFKDGAFQFIETVRLFHHILHNSTDIISCIIKDDPDNEKFRISL